MNVKILEAKIQNKKEVCKIYQEFINETHAINIEDLLKQKSFKLVAGVKEGIIAMLGWGISLFLLVLVSKELSWFLPAFTFRILILTILFTFLVFTKKSFLPKRSVKFPWVILILIGVFDILAFFSYSFGVSGSGGAIVAPISSAYALVTIILGAIFLREKIKPRQLLGIAGIVTGLILISL